MSNLETLRIHVNALKMLLDDAHPEATTWCQQYAHHMAAASDFWLSEDNKRVLVESKGENVE